MTEHFVIYETATGDIISLCSSGLTQAQINANWPLETGQSLAYYGAGAVAAPITDSADNYRVVAGVVTEKEGLSLALSVVGGGDWLADGVSTLQVIVTGVVGGDTVLMSLAGPLGTNRAETTGDTTMTFTTSELGQYLFRVRTLNTGVYSKIVRAIANAV